LKKVSFSDPFFDEISKYPVKFATPVFFGESPYSSNSAFLRNGTATLLMLSGRYLGVTCHHVLDGYRQFKEKNNGFLHMGPIRVDPEKYLISEDKDHDLAIFDLTNLVGTLPELGEANFVQPGTWPPCDVSKEDVICMAGFPGVWRDQVGVGHLRFYSYSSGAAEVVSVRDNSIVTTVQIADCVTQINHGKVWGSLGGLSGGPVFVWRKTPILIAELVGFIYEYQESLDLMFVRSANVIGIDGKIISNLSLHN
jgi:hypothetical protein